MDDWLERIVERQRWRAGRDGADIHDAYVDIEALLLWMSGRDESILRTLRSLRPGWPFMGGLVSSDRAGSQRPRGGNGS